MGIMLEWLMLPHGIGGGKRAEGDRNQAVRPCQRYPIEAMDRCQAVKSKGGRGTSASHKGRSEDTSALTVLGRKIMWITAPPLSG